METVELNMTIEDIIAELKDASDHEIKYGDIKNHYDEVMKRVVAFDMAIKSLKAWEKVQMELKTKRDEYSGRGLTGTAFGISRSMDSIEKHLSEWRGDTDG